MIKIFTRQLAWASKPWLFSTLTSTNPTIYALSSGVNSAISIVRVSGPEAYKILNLLKPNQISENLSKDELLSQCKIKAREMTLKSIYGHNKELIDKCLLVYFPAKSSYSGEDMIELHLHGSRAVVAAVFRQLSRLEFSAAKRGEFTRRAVLNKRMSLQEAEAVGDLVLSHLQFERQVAISNLTGKNKTFLQEIRLKMINVLARVEAFIEFQEEEVGSGLLEQVKVDLLPLLNQFKRVLESSRQLQSAREGVKISIVGCPNVGKSTLINSLMGRDIAIVSPIPGTTRDLIESQLQVSGFRVKVVDTAGLRTSTCLIQQEGMRRTKNSIQESNLILVLMDISAHDYEEREDSLIMHPHQQEKNFLKIQNSIIIINKIDTLSDRLKTKTIKIQKQIGSIQEPDLTVSLKNSDSVEFILAKVGDYLKAKFSLCSEGSSEIYFTRARYIEGLEQCCKLLEESLSKDYADLVSANIRAALSAVEQLLGRVDNEEILDSVFSQFCIGK